MIDQKYVELTTKRDDSVRASNLQIVMNNFCNSRCEHCKIWEEEDRKQITLEDCMKLKFTPNLRHIDLTGGETFLYSKFDDVLDYFTSEQQIEKVSITTNGILVQKTYDDIVDLSRLQREKLKIFVSIDGPREIHNVVRGLDCFDKAVNTVSRLQELDVKVGISYTANDFSASRFAELRDYMQKTFGIKINSINIPNVSKFYKNSLNLFSTPYTSLSLENFEKYFSSLLNSEFMREKLTTGGTSLRCTSLMNKLVIDSEKFVRGCFSEWNNDFIITDLDTIHYDLNKVYSLDKYWELRQRSFDKKCSDCFTNCENSCWFKYDSENQRRLVK